MGANVHPRGTPISTRIQDRITIDANTGCWTWSGPIQPNGYAMMSVGRSRRYVHRLAFETWIGPIPRGLDIDHLCRNRACCNPQHLEPVARAENINRGNGPNVLARLNGNKTHCANGHEFTSDNTRMRPSGGRRCRTCARDESRAKRSKLRGIDHGQAATHR